jgi:cytoskeletal protein RodZ
MASIGETLKKARERKKLTLEAVFQASRIHLKVLKALESDEFQSLPGILYVKSFLKKYAEFLGLDSEEILKQYLSLSPQPPQQIFTIGENKKKKLPPFSRISPKFLLAALGAVLVIFILFSTAKFLRHQKTLRGERRSQRSVSVPESSRRQMLVPEEEPLVLRIRARKDVWLQLRADGKMIFQHILQKGTEESWNAQDDFELWVGDAGGLSLSLNGKPLPSLGSGVKRGIIINHQGLHTEH